MIKNSSFFLTAFLFFSTGAFAVDEQEENTKKKLPIGAELYVSHSVGASTAFKAYQQDPYVATTFYAYPYLSLGPFWGEREWKLHAEMSTCLEWMGQDNPFPGTLRKKFIFGDIKIRSELKKALHFKDAGFTLSPAFEVEAPVSKGALIANRVMGLGGYVTATLSKWGLFIIYKPVVTAYVHSAPYKSDDCAADANVVDNIGNGVCKVSGRQTMVLLKNGLVTGYTEGNHTISLGFRSYHSFLRDKESGEKAEKTPSSGIMEATLGVLEYAYNFPVTFPTTLYFGLSGYQSPYDAKNSFRWPFISFSEPEKNLTEAYVAVNVAI